MVLDVYCVVQCDDEQLPFDVSFSAFKEMYLQYASFYLQARLWADNACLFLHTSPQEHSNGFEYAVV
jgi:hypothetical protein